MSRYTQIVEFAQAVSIRQLRLTKKKTLVDLYHQAQLAYVACKTEGLETEALVCIMLVVICREIVMSRVSKPDHGHAVFYSEMVAEYHNCRSSVNWGTPFQFTSSRLVGNAMESKINVPKYMRPEGWTFKKYKQEIGKMPLVG